MSASVNTYCRLCAGFIPNTKLVNLHLDINLQSEISKKLATINASPSGLFSDTILPKTVCLECISTLNTAFDFVVNVELAQVTLNNILLDAVKDIKSESLLGKKNQESAEDSVDSEEDVDFQTIKDEPGISKAFAELELPFDVVKTQNKAQYLDATQLELTWQDYIWTCSCCGTQFSNVEELKSHSIKYHDRCNPFRCIDCNRKKLRLDKFIIHVKRHRKYLKLSCYICFENFSTLRETRQHHKVHLKFKHICIGCNATFPTTEDLNKHKSSLIKGFARPIPNIQYARDSLTCAVCQKTFKTKHILNSHLFIHTNRQPEHSCDKCGKCFYYKHNLRLHILLHNNARPFECAICKSAFKTKPQLREHVKVHNGQKPHTCDQCGRSFRLKKQLNNHSIIHTDALPHSCTICDKQFRFKNKLQQHIQQHTGAKPYTCELCPRDFTNWSNYNKHMKRIHDKDMSKKKRTPDGVFPIDQNTGEIIICHVTEKLEKWKKQILSPMRKKSTLALKSNSTDQIYSSI